MRYLWGECGYQLKRMWINQKRKNALKSFNEELPNIIADIIADLVSGKTLLEAFERIALECSKPMKEDFETVLAEASFGIGIEEALVNLSNRVPSIRLELLVHSVIINKQQGGDLVEALEKVLEELSERKIDEEKLQLVEKNNKIFGGLAGAVPIITVFVLYMLYYENLESLFSNLAGKAIINTVFVAVIIALVNMKKPIKFERKTKLLKKLS
jgi:tight adherence protein B